MYDKNLQLYFFKVSLSKLLIDTDQGQHKVFPYEIPGSFLLQMYVRPCLDSLPHEITIWQSCSKSFF